MGWKLTAPKYESDPEYVALARRMEQNPHDDLPRLMLADWIEEHDDPERATNIRRSVEFSRLLRGATQFEE